MDDQEYGHQRFNAYLEKSARDRRRNTVLGSLLAISVAVFLGYHFLPQFEAPAAAVTPTPVQPRPQPYSPPVEPGAYSLPPVQQQESPPENNVPVMHTSNMIELHRQPGGGFFMQGAVNGVPVTFQIDTGASYTSISKETAYSAGIYGCDGKMFDTANGQVFGCVARADEIRLGQNVMKGFQIAAMPNLNGALLGMNVLKQFKIEHEGDVMRLTIATGVSSGQAESRYVPIPVQVQPPPPVVTPEPEQVKPVPYQYQPSIPSRADIEVRCKAQYDSSREPYNELMRHGYTAQQGEYYRDRLRAIELEYRQCRA